MSEFPAVIGLSSLNGLDGFRIEGAAAGDRSGFCVSSAGDVNGDGFDDIIVGAYGADPNGSGTGASYVVFGKAGGFAASLNLSSLNGANGFRLSGVAELDASGRSVSNAGDVNGDGFDDIIVGAFGAEGVSTGPYERSSVGASYVVFGKEGGFGANLNLSSLNGSNGFKLSGEALGDECGISVSTAGDINGDGFDDLIVGAHGADSSSYGSNAGTSYVVFGKEGGFGANLNLSSLNGSNGFRIDGYDAGDQLGRSVSSAGDVNGDGFDDLIVGAPYGAVDPGYSNSGASFVVFGKAGAFNANVKVRRLDGTDGFGIGGIVIDERGGASVSSAGDVNGDGFDDLIVGASNAVRDEVRTTESYVVFGKAAGFAPMQDVSSLNGTNGFTLRSAFRGPYQTIAVSEAGDVNGDGFGDLIVGTTATGANGEELSASYVVFGKAGGFAAHLELSSLNGNNGFKLVGPAGLSGTGLSVSSAGDVNSDGFDDILVGAPLAQTNGRASGDSYLVFGRAPTEAVTRTGTNAANTISGGAFNDTLIGLGGNDTLRAIGGNDRLFGDEGDDTFLVDGSGDRVFEASGEGNDRVSALNSYTLQAGQAVETLALADAAGTASLNLTGNEFGQRLLGNAGANLLDGGGGADNLYGFGGSDTYRVDNAGDRVFELANSGSDRVEASVSYALSAGQSVETLATTDAASTAALNLTGNELGQRLIGNAGANILDGKGGADNLYGLGGDDTYRVDNAGDLVFEAANAGFDRVNASLSYRLASGQSIERLSLADAGGTQAYYVVGNEFGQTVTGNAGANLIDGGGGIDVLFGFGGADTFRFSTAFGNNNIDRIADFVSGLDTIRLDRSIFTALDLGALTAGAYKDIGDPGAVVDADDRILYNDDTGALFYDSNGSGAGGRYQFATLDTKPATLTASDFFVVA